MFLWQKTVYKINRLKNFWSLELIITLRTNKTMSNQIIIKAACAKIKPLHIPYPTFTNVGLVLNFVDLHSPQFFYLKYFIFHIPHFLF